MVKRQVVNFQRANNGGSTWISFVVGSKSYKAYFGVKWDSAGISNGKSWLTISNDTLPLERKTANIEALQNLGFNCSITLR